MTELIDIFRALADPTRLRVVALLREMELAIGELAVVLEQSQPRVSRHVRILADAGIIERRREGSWVFLRIAEGGPVGEILARAELWPFSPREALIIGYDAQRLAAVRTERAAVAERYFADHAAEWDAIRSRHIPESEVEAAMLALVAGRRLGHLLDIGTGTGRMAEIFAPSVRRITALDRSPEMLRIARAKLADQPVPIDLVQGDFLNLPLDDATIDSIVIHQALHFAHEPDRVIAEASRVLRGGGHLLIVDFAPHEDEEMRNVAAHARLGFSDAQMRGWFASAGMVLENSQTLEGGDLAVKLWLGRRRSDEDQSPVREDGQRKRLAA
ncbi:ArsR family transcriptional regulator [Sphingopyxis sp. Root1497]|uniref:ArsR/SmtB family transcription factor n=1 Tax=Sphingopyxis sp. Root1497 TaxID=1736474 RepID=UPI0006F2F91A|nr:metalloregulator ArsR/SmtB family transcription factor [Sphingopyxis sp. Root1497]KQZ65180.1 ArsR family transcriptional regulator [Sphingopyxis sp. Root1497]OHC99688.1 MAG: ArsR family transcriptional regulator [Sphingopyxis sp. RIFCSPHIGHO2_01_FULL_65_24]